MESAENSGRLRLSYEDSLDLKRESRYDEDK